MTGPVRRRSKGIKFPERHAPIAHAGTIGVLELIAAKLEHPQGIVCDACGCLCKPDEVCLGCLAWRAGLMPRAVA